MRQPFVNSIFLAKTALATVLLLALAAVAGSQLAPKMALLDVLLYSAVLVLGLFALLLVATVVMLTVYQAVLRWGGTDPQWFWFRSEPPGLAALRGHGKATPPKDAQPR